MVICFLYIKRGLVPPLQAQQQTPTFTKTVVSCLSKPTHVILHHSGTDMASIHQCNKASLSLFYHQKATTQVTWFSCPHHVNTLICCNSYQFKNKISSLQVIYLAHLHSILLFIKKKTHKNIVKTQTGSINFSLWKESVGTKHFYLISHIL